MLKYTATILILASLVAPIGAQPGSASGPRGALRTVDARAASQAGVAGYDGVVEAVRQTVLAAQVAGAIVELRVKAGDAVKTGQVLARIDARAAEQSATASQAQVQAARASLDVAAKDFDRQKQLFQKRFISQAALDQSEAVYKASASQVAAQIAQAGAARSQSDFFILRAPYNGIVADVPVVLGDMAMPGRAILTMYDPSALRVTATIPQTVVTPASIQQGASVELPGATGTRNAVKPTFVTVLPTADPDTHTLQIRLDLAAGTAGIVPGMFARVWLPVAAATDGRVFVPVGAIVRRAEMTGVYVVDTVGKPMLRQVRLGRTADDAIEVLSGIAVGERVATDPEAAARVR